MAVYYFCGMVGTGTMLDPRRPAIADEPGVTSWAANQQVGEYPVFVVTIADPTGALNTALGYRTGNTNGYLWFEVNADGSITPHGTVKRLTDLFGVTKLSALRDLRDSGREFLRQLCGTPDAKWPGVG